MNKRTKLIGLTIFLLIALYAWGKWGSVLFPVETSQNNQAPSPAMMALPVEAVPVQVADIIREVTAVGTLTSNEKVMIRPEIAGRIQNFFFKEGGSVNKEMPLVKLEDASLKAELEQAKANLSLSQANNERAMRLFEQGAGTARVRDEASAKLKLDQASLEVAKVRLDKTVITAPFDGIIGLRKVSVGAYLAPGEDIVNLESIDPIKVDFRVPEIYLSSVQQGQKIQILADAFPNKDFEGMIYALNPALDEQGRSLIIRATLSNKDKVLRPGLFVRLSLTLSQAQNALQIPEQALVPSAQGVIVFKVIDGKAIPQTVTTGKRQKGMVEITQGLTPQDVVVTAGQIKLRPNTPVTILPNKIGA